MQPAQLFPYTNQLAKINFGYKFNLGLVSFSANISGWDEIKAVQLLLQQSCCRWNSSILLFKGFLCSNHFLHIGSRLGSWRVKWLTQSFSYYLSRENPKMSVKENLMRNEIAILLQVQHGQHSTCCEKSNNVVVAFAQCQGQCTLIVIVESLLISTCKR